jgi:hypothetical protein
VEQCRRKNPAFSGLPDQTLFHQSQTFVCARPARLSSACCSSGIAGSPSFDAISALNFGLAKGRIVNGKRFANLCDSKHGNEWWIEQV